MELDNTFGTVCTELSQRNMSDGTLGLVNGLTGTLISNIVIHKISEQSHLLDKVDEDWEFLLDNIHGAESIDFNNGVTGIGWGLEFLGQNDLFEGVESANSILNDIDDILYQLIIYGDTIEMTVNNGLIGRFMYFSKRYTSLKKNFNRFQLTAIKESLIILSDQIREQLITQVEGVYFFDSHDVAKINNILPLICALCNEEVLSVNRFIMNDILVRSCIYLDRILEKELPNPNQNQKVEPKLRNTLMKVAFVYWRAAVLKRNIYWKERSLMFMNILKDAKYFEPSNLDIRKDIQTDAVYFLCSDNDRNEVMDPSMTDLDIQQILELGIQLPILSLLSLSYPNLLKWDDLLLLG